MTGTTIEAREVCEGLDGLLVAATAPAGASFRRAAIDSREAAAGDLFFALHGEHSDGHDFVSQALTAGAAGAVVERPVQVPGDPALFQASDSLGALQALAAHRRRHRPDLRVIGVTGSVGKTTCKELIAGILAAKYGVLKSEANLNTEIGVPLTLFQLQEEHQKAVLEMAMYARGDIALLARIASPQVGVVTNIGPVHLGRLGSLGAIVAAKAELVEALPADGLAVLNGDDARVASLTTRTAAPTLLFGTSEQCDVRAGQIISHGLHGISFRLEFRGEAVEATCPLPGKHHVYPALAAVAVAMNEGMTLGECVQALAAAGPDLRLAARQGPNGSTIIDDSYNASPASMLAALDLLSELPGRRIAVLGEMRELGAASLEGHRSIGRRAASACDLLIVVGESPAAITEEAKAGGLDDVRQVSDPQTAAALLRSELRPGDYALIKASRAVGLETLVSALVAAG